MKRTVSVAAFSQPPGTRSPHQPVTHSRFLTPGSAIAQDFLLGGRHHCGGGCHGFLTLPAIVLIILAPGTTPADKLADFSRFASAQGEEVAVVDMFGTERIGKLVTASEASVTLEFGSATQAFDHVDVFKRIACAMATATAWSRAC